MENSNKKSSVRDIFVSTRKPAGDEYEIHPESRREPSVQARRKLPPFADILMAPAQVTADR